jgi:oligoribonuclease (3'-5' exoribonuclease)
MKTFTLFDTEYSLSPQSHDFLSQYLARVERYITRRSLDPSYLEDLKERMKDKLDRIEPPIEKQSIIDLVNEL